MCSPFNEHEVEIRENKNGKPYFTCREETGNTTVNLNGERSIQMLEDYLIDDSDVSLEQEEPEIDEEPDETEPKGLDDILGGSNA